MKASKPFISIKILPEMIGLRLDKALSLHSEVGSRNRSQYLIDKELVLINKAKAKNSQIIKSTDIIEISFPDAVPSELVPSDLKLDILYEDPDILVVNKPAGLVVHPSAGHAQDTLVNALLGHTDELSMKFGEERPGIVHRLDKDTSGILVVAKNDFAHESLVKQFKERSTHRIYYAVCLGIPPKSSGTIQSYLARHPTDRKKFASIRLQNKIQTTQDPVPDIGKWAVTHYKVIKTLPSGISYLQLKLETGRTHQIRVHLSENGLPIAGDTLYGADKKIKNIKNHAHRDIIERFPRFALHAAELGFHHPKRSESLAFKVDWPADLKPLLLELELGQIL